MPFIKEPTIPSPLNTRGGEVDLDVAGADVSTLARCAIDVEQLCLEVQQDISQSLKEAHFIDLVRNADASVVNGLLPLLRCEDAWLRNKAIEALREMPDAVAPKMMSLLRDADSDVRIFAINVLETLRHSDVESWLITTVEEDEHPNVVGAALDLLAEVGTAACMDALRSAEVRFADEPYLQFVSRTAMKRIEASLDV